MTDQRTFHEIVLFLFQNLKSVCFNQAYYTPQSVPRFLKLDHGLSVLLPCTTNHGIGNQFLMILWKVVNKSVLRIWRNRGDCLLPNRYCMQLVNACFIFKNSTLRVTVTCNHCVLSHQVC